MVSGFLIIWFLHGLSALIAFIAGAKKKRRKEVEEIYIDIPIRLYVWLAVLAVYLIIRYLTGWRITGWYGEAITILLIFSFFDYYIIYKYRLALSQQIKRLYLIIRVSFLSFIVLRLMATVFLAFLSFPFFSIQYFLLPLNRSLGEKHIQGNIYFYENKGKGGFVFKRKLYFIEKDLVFITGDGNSVLSTQGRRDPPTGYITKKGNEMFIHGSGNGGRQNHYIQVTILPEKKLKIESIHKYWEPTVKSSVVKKDLHAIINY